MSSGKAVLSQVPSTRLDITRFLLPDLKLNFPKVVENPEIAGVLTILYLRLSFARYVVVSKRYMISIKNTFFTIIAGVTLSLFSYFF